MHDFVLMELQRRREILPVALILTLSLVLNVLGITWGLPHYVDWAIDSMALDTLQAIAKHFANGWFDKYPPVHHATLAVFYTPYIAYLAFWGIVVAEQGLSIRTHKSSFYPHEFHFDREKPERSDGRSHCPAGLRDSVLRV
jgi:hypothetical protein